MFKIPHEILKDVQKSIFEFIYFPRQKETISKDEMERLRVDGGAKLIDIDVKSEAYMVCWLIDLFTMKHLTVHLALVTSLLGVQKGGLQGADLFFTTNDYANKILSTPYPYYRKAIQAITKFHLRKKIDNIRDKNSSLIQHFRMIPTTLFGSTPPVSVTPFLLMVKS